MAGHSSLETDLPVEVDVERQWSVYRCAHGCFHVALDRVTLTLTEDEFHALQTLMHQACVRFHSCTPPLPVLKRAH